MYTEESERTLLEMLSSARSTNPEDLIISQEELDDIEKNIGHILSDLEWQVLEGYLDGKSYQEMAKVLIVASSRLIMLYKGLNVN